MTRNETWKNKVSNGILSLKEKGAILIEKFNQQIHVSDPLLKKNGVLGAGTEFPYNAGAEELALHQLIVRRKNLMLNRDKNISPDAVILSPPTEICIAGHHIEGSTAFFHLAVRYGKRINGIGELPYPFDMPQKVLRRYSDFSFFFRRHHLLNTTNQVRDKNTVLPPIPILPVDLDGNYFEKITNDTISRRIEGLQNYVNCLLHQANHPKTPDKTLQKLLLEFLGTIISDNRDKSGNFLRGTNTMKDSRFLRIRERRMSDAMNSTQVPINIYWLRHGMSCANVCM